MGFFYDEKTETIKGARIAVFGIVAILVIILLALLQDKLGNH